MTCLGLGLGLGLGSGFGLGQVLHDLHHLGAEGGGDRTPLGQDLRELGLRDVERY